MTKKRHSKLLRAFVTRIHEYGMKQGYKAPHGKAMYKCTRMGFVENPKVNIKTRLDYWKAVEDAVVLFGMGDIKELRK